MRQILFPKLSRLQAAVVLAILIAFGLVFRLSYFANDNPFPINDGALFYTYIKAIYDNGMSLPEFIFFNGSYLPFAYPPLSFWISALIVLIGVDPLTVVKYYPLLMNIIFISLYVIFLRTMRLSWGMTVLATAIFLFSYRSFEYLIMGGGVSRSTGAVFTLASMILAHSAATGEWIYIIATSSLVACSILSHPEWGIDSALGVSLIILLYGTNWSGKLKIITAIGVISAVLLLPWLCWVIAHHGFGPLLAAKNTSDWSIFQSSFLVISLSFFPKPLIFLGTIGIWYTCKNRELFWIVFSIMTVFLTPRHHPTAVTISNSVLAAVGTVRLFDGFMRAVPRFFPQLSKLIHESVLSIFLVSLVSVYMSIASWYLLSKAESMHTLNRETQNAMSWIRHNQIIKSGKFIVLTPDDWWLDAVNEWFPVLTDAISLTIVQGKEWETGGRFQETEEKVSILKELPGCPYIMDYAIAEFPTANYVMSVIYLDCLDYDHRLKRIYRNPSAGIWQIVRQP